MVDPFAIVDDEAVSEPLPMRNVCRFMPCVQCGELVLDADSEFVRRLCVPRKCRLCAVPHGYANDPHAAEIRRAAEEKFRGLFNGVES